MKPITAGFCCAVLAVLGWGEVEHWRASRRRLGSTESGPGAREAVVVLGFRNRGDRINAVNRWRLRAGLRSLDGPRTRLVLSGGPVGGGRPEADLMASYARTRYGYRGPLLVETESRSTWENVANVIPLIEDAERIKVVSHSLHAEKARAYLWLQRPDLAARLVRARDYRPGEWLLLKPALALLGRRNLRRVGGDGRRSGVD
ncbi:YdcF family protein [Actinomadura fibrosa]|uniref:YdcF family protein n=1 Tax=Actinomadura fibrosa TaxID=111802 RepID=A0ABW2Y2C9_9ACTN|nr:YdcF family protein [Actinomadura fibrosa]